MSRDTTTPATPTCDHCGEDLVQAWAPGDLVLACAKCMRLVPHDMLGRTYWPAPAPVEPVQCRECPRVEDAAAWIPEAGERIRRDRLCLRCGHWMELLEDRDNPINARIEGRHYRITPDLPEGEVGFRGFGGAKHLVRFHDGRMVVTRNLWTQGTIPRHFRERLSDNAVFLTPCTYCDRDATGRLGFYWGQDRPVFWAPHCGDKACGRDRSRADFVPYGGAS